MKSILLLVSPTTVDLYVNIFILCLIVLVIGIFIVVILSPTNERDDPYQIGPDPKKETKPNVMPGAQYPSLENSNKYLNNCILEQTNKDIQQIVSVTNKIKEINLQIYKAVTAPHQKSIDPLISTTNKIKEINLQIYKDVTAPHQKSIDPLRILREDTYTNEEINEMTGKMIREEYKRKNP